MNLRHLKSADDPPISGEKGKTVIVTIHQPSSELYEMFDKVMLMAEGRVAFLGDLALAGSFFTE